MIGPHLVTPEERKRERSNRRIYGSSVLTPEMRAKIAKQASGSGPMVIPVPFNVIEDVVCDYERGVKEWLAHDFIRRGWYKMLGYLYPPLDVWPGEGIGGD